MVPVMPLAQTLADAISTLTVGPLDESQEDWYVGNPTSTASGRTVPPLAMLRASLLRARDSERLFLSGHVGSGKSTELARLLRDPAILRKFFVVSFAIADEEIGQLTTAHLLFIIAAELYTRARAQGLLGKHRRRWEAILKRLDERFGPKGISASEGSLELKLNLVVVELRQQLKLQDRRREEFRAFAESEGTILVDLINALAEDITLAVMEAGIAERVLIVIDDIDKIRSSPQIEEIFQKNLAALRAPQLPILMTLPATVTFGGPTTELGANITHIRPVQVLQKTESTDPRAALDRGAMPYMRAVLGKRVREGLFDEDVVESAAVYSGGVLRKFFELLRNAAIRAADLYGLPTVNAITFNDQLEDEKNDLARATYPADRAVLAQIHKQHALPDREALRLMNASLVLEYNHAGIWWDANPLVWHVLT
jgi:hypothetical protein